MKMKKEYDTHFETDTTLLDGLHFTLNEQKVKRNIKNFDIKIQPAKTGNDVGIKFSKIGDFLVITFNMRLHPKSFTAQFLLEKHINHIDVLNSDHPALNGFKAVVMNGCDLVKLESVGDISSLGDFFNNGI